jgi:transposase
LTWTTENTRHRRGNERVGEEAGTTATTARRRALEAAGLVHPNPAGVTAALFDGTRPFFLAADKVQVKYEMLRAHVVEGQRVRAAAADHGYSRAAFYLIAAAFDERGMAGLLDEQRGRRGPLKLTPELVAFIAAADPSLSGAELAEAIDARFGVSLHRRTIERARRR